MSAVHHLSKPKKALILIRKKHVIVAIILKIIAGSIFIFGTMPNARTDCTQAYIDRYERKFDLKNSNPIESNIRNQLAINSLMGQSVGTVEFKVGTGLGLKKAEIMAGLMGGRIRSLTTEQVFEEFFNEEILDEPAVKSYLNRYRKKIGNIESEQELERLKSVAHIILDDRNSSELFCSKKDKLWSLYRVKDHVLAGLGFPKVRRHGRHAHSYRLKPEISELNNLGR
jgi:hypothetical protein